MYKLQRHIGFTNLWSNMPRICVISSQRVKNGTRTPCTAAIMSFKFRQFKSTFLLEKELYSLKYSPKSKLICLVCGTVWVNQKFSVTIF